MVKSRKEKIEKINVLTFEMIIFNYLYRETTCVYPLNIKPSPICTHSVHAVVFQDQPAGNRVKVDAGGTWLIPSSRPSTHSYTKIDPGEILLLYSEARHRRCGSIARASATFRRKASTKFHGARSFGCSLANVVLATLQLIPSNVLGL